MDSGLAVPARRSPPLPLAALAAAVAAAGLAVAGATARAATIVITGPLSVSTASSNEVQFSGTVAGIVPGTEADYIPLIQGLPPTSPLALQVNGTYTFDTVVPIGPGPPPGGFPPGFPYADFYSEPNRVMLPILAELLHAPSKAVIDRSKSFFWDLRGAGTVTIRPRGVPAELGVQLTEAGIDALEPAHLSSLPFPDLPAFNAALFDAYAGRAQAVETSTGFFNPDKTCVPLSDVPEFAATPEFRELVFTKALPQLMTYALFRSIPWPTWPICVQQWNLLALDHYEVCFGRVDGELTDVALASVDDVDLGVDTTHETVTAEVELGRVDQTVEGKLAGAFIRWRDGSFACTTRDLLVQQVADETLASDPALAALTTCSGLRADATQIANAVPAEFDFTASSEPEEFDTHDDAVGRFVVPVAGRTTESSHGACAQAFINTDVERLLSLYYAPLEDALEAAWFGGAPESSHAKALDLLLTTAEHGTFDDALDHELTTIVTSGGVASKPGFGALDGAYFVFDTDAALKPAFTVATVPPVWIAPGSIGDLPWSADGGCAHLSNRHLFDLSFATSTGALNQVLRELSASGRLRFALPQVQSAAVGAVVAAIDPSISPAAVQVDIEPTLAPFTWMPPDPQGVESGFAEIAYHLHDLLGTVTDTGAGRTVLRFRIDFLEPALDLSFNGTLGADFLVAALTGAHFAVTILDTDLASCPMQPHDASGLTSCDRLTEAALALVLRGTVEDAMIDVLSDYPAPQFFDAQGYAGIQQQIKNADRYQWDQYIVLYGVIPAP